MVRYLMRSLSGTVRVDARTKLLNLKKTLFLSVPTITLVFAVSVRISATLEVPQDQVVDLAQNSSLDARILRVENGLSSQNSKSEAPNATFKLIDRMKFYKTPGVSVAVINDGKIEWVRGYGVQEAGGNKLITPETLFQAASISKPVTAMAVLKLVQEGKLDLDADVNKTLISWKVPNNRFTQTQRVTLRNLLSHSAGLTVHGFRGYSAGEQVPTLLQILDGTKPSNSKAIKVNSKPDSTFKYSGGGYVVIQKLLLDFTGQQFDAFMKDTVLDKLGMANSAYQ